MSRPTGLARAYMRLPNPIFVATSTLYLHEKKLVLCI